MGHVLRVGKGMMRAEGRQGGRDNLLDHWARVQGEAGHGGQAGRQARAGDGRAEGRRGELTTQALILKSIS